MEPERWRRIEDLYHAAQAIDPARRGTFLRDSCGGDARLLAEVEDLLGFDSRAGAFIETPALHVLARQEARAMEASAGFRLAPGEKLGPYEILQPLGAGGMGEIYSARDTRLGRTVALKILTARGMDQAGFLERLEREARAISNLNHPHICTLHDIGRDRDIDYLVMEFVEGQSLAERLKQGLLPLPELLQIAMETAEALDYAHRQGVIHRDLKPGNIMLTGRGAKLVDFGLAIWREEPETSGAGGSLEDPALTQAGSVLGTPQYMAPEQARRGRADARTDIFALGLVMFEMASGRKALDGDRATPALAGPNAVLNGVIGGCLKVAPGERWQSAAELIGELKRIGTGGRSKTRVWMAVAAIAILAAGAWVVRAITRTAAAAEQVLYSFTGGNGDGSRATAAVARGRNGNLYGTNTHGGRFGKGAIYELHPAAGEWRERAIYSFSGGSDGNDPFPMLTAGERGEFYGVTQRGGDFNKGTVYELAPDASGAWAERVLHHFSGQPDGINPRPDLILGKNGALFGTTSDGGLPGGDEGFGTVFELAPPATPMGEWIEHVLYRFTGANGDGANPFGNVVWGTDGSLYGTTFGGPTGPGSVYRLSPPADPEGAWKETVLHRFVLNSDEGRSPVGDLAMGADGTVYGTTQWGGISENGVIFSLKRPESGAGDWRFTVLHRFTSHIGDAAEPTSGILIGADGSLYGTTVKGGTWGNGAVYRLTPERGSWTETVLYSFTGHQGDGAGPQCIGRLLLEGGALYGTTEVGGTFNLGTVFKLTLPK